MEEFMKTCYRCGGKVTKYSTEKEGINLNCMKCEECGEEYFTSSELLKFDIKTGREKLVRKFGTLGDSTIVRLPTEILENFKIEPGDYGVFEKVKDGILIKPIKKKELSV